MIKFIARYSIGIFIFAFLAGCSGQKVYMPRIVPSSDNQTSVTHQTVKNESHSQWPEGWIPSGVDERDWNAIIIHHSATSQGNAAIFDKWHRENNHWDGVGYDFVIGNGSESGDGKVEVTFRWKQQRTGAHCGGTPDNWANRKGIGICLVGNFNVSRPSGKQMNSLLKLVRFLKSRYNIPKNRIFGHGQTPGAHTTDCPGTKFPMAWFKSRL